MFHNSSGSRKSSSSKFIADKKNPTFLLKAPVSHPPLSQFNRTFHKTNRSPLHTIPVLPGHWWLTSWDSYPHVGTWDLGLGTSCEAALIILGCKSAWGTCSLGAKWSQWQRVIGWFACLMLPLIQPHLYILLISIAEWRKSAKFQLLASCIYSGAVSGEVFGLS